MFIGDLAVQAAYELGWVPGKIKVVGGDEPTWTHTEILADGQEMITHEWAFVWNPILRSYKEAMLRYGGEC